MSLFMKVLHQTDEEIKEIDAQIQKERVKKARSRKILRSSLMSLEEFKKLTHTFHVTSDEEIEWFTL